ncbi:MAG: hypothetical protein CMK59_02170 [Proteobacteria bacterium]|nr:hypothetical protein [Pseudomonadota bacterium]
MSYLFLMINFVACFDYQVNRRYVTDSYVQPSRESGVDILWVVDDSASMFEEQDQLSLHADGFVSFLSMAPIDYRMGITTTDVSIDQPGALVGELMTPETSDVAALFQEQMILEEGNREEEGFSAALEALDPEGVNQGLFNTGSDLELIFFSDEDDQSDLNVNTFVAELQALRASPVIAVNAVVGDPPLGCASLFGAADAGSKYQKAQEKTEGLRESICSLNYEAMLNRMAMKVLGLQDRIFLSSPPDLETMEVRIDGALIHQRDRHGWRYDAGENSVIFDGYAVPYPGAEVVVRYAQWIGPPKEWGDEEIELEEEDDEGNQGGNNGVTVEVGSSVRQNNEVGLTPSSEPLLFDSGTQILEEE